MSDLRSSAAAWRTMAMVALVLGLIGVFVFAIVAAREPFGGSFQPGVFFGIWLGWSFALILSMGLFFMVTSIMEGLADLVDNTRPQQAQPTRSSSSRPVARSASPSPAIPAPQAARPSYAYSPRPANAPAPPAQAPASFCPWCGANAPGYGGTCPSCGHSLADPAAPAAPGHRPSAGDLPLPAVLASTPAAAPPSPVIVPLAFVPPHHAPAHLEAALRADPSGPGGPSPLILDLTDRAPGYLQIVGYLLDVVANQGSPGDKRDVTIIGDSELVRTATAHARQRTWSWALADEGLSVQVRTQ